MSTRRKSGVPKKKKGQDKENESKEGKETENVDVRNDHGTKVKPTKSTKTTKPAGKRNRGAFDSDPDESSEGGKYGHMAASAAGALVME